MEVSSEKKSSENNEEDMSITVQQLPTPKTPPEFYQHVEKNSQTQPDWQRHYVLFALAAFLLLLSLMLLVGALTLNYLVESTENFGMMPDCLTQEIKFDRWFVTTCTECAAGFTKKQSSFGCVLI